MTDLTESEAVLESANEGDTLQINLRGPCSDEEKDLTRKEYESVYPGIKFVIEDNAPKHSVIVIGGNVNGESDDLGTDESGS